MPRTALLATATSALMALSVIGTAQATSHEPAVAQDDSSNIQIVGGQRATEAYSWTAYTGGCGGSLIAPRWVVTAAHCLKIKPYKIRLNSHNRWSGGENLTWTNIYKHPKYGTGAGYDIGLIQLSEPASVAPIPVAASAGSVGTRTRILGWGAQNPDGSNGSSMLNELDTSILSPNRCDGVDGDVNAKLEICTDSPRGNSGACYGDSGGPQVKKVNGRWELIGATSRGGERCASDPAIYTNVSAHMKWIREVSNNAVPLPVGWQDPGEDVSPTPTPTPTFTPTPTPTVTATPTPTVTATPTPTANPGDDEFSDKTPQQLKDYGTVTSTVNSTYANAKKVQLSVDINHSCAQHVGIDLTTPDGKRNVVKRSSYATGRRCGAWNGVKSETYTMRSTSNGPWKIEVSDNYRGYTGTFNGWSVKFS